MPVGRAVSLERKPISAGRRNRSIVIEQLTESVGASRFPVEAWTRLATEFMSREDQRADERFTGEQESSYLETAWRMPYRADMDPELIDVTKKRRLNDRGRIHNIRSAAVIGFREAIVVITLGT